MGSLHAGHISLVKKSKEKTDITVVSIFVNPTQFGPGEDFGQYPRNFNDDKHLLEKEKVDILFYPSTDEIYNKDYQSYVEVTKITQKYEGEYRPEHFRGVTTIVNILFNCVKPHFAFFGQKDAQQAAVIQRMVNDLKYDIKMVICPIVREEDGLAMSSRNIYLSQKERKDALVIYESLMIGKKMIEDGEKSAQKIISKMSEHIFSVENSNPDYIKIVAEVSLEEETVLIKGEKYFILVACKIGKTRLIDNVVVKAN
jgi:pantoate--beta-alanine ligase